MDPFTALGVAAAALQFFDFTKILFKEYRTLRNQAHHITEETFEAAAKDLQGWVLALGNAPPRGSRREAKLLKHELALTRLAAACGEIAKELLEALERLKPEAKQTTWTSLSQALQKIWKAEKIANMRRELDDYRDQIGMRVLACLNEKMDMSMDQLDLTLDMQREQMGMQREQLKAVQRSNDEIVGVLAFNHEELHKAILELKSGESKTIVEEPLDPFYDSRREKRGSVAPHAMMTIRASWDDNGVEATMGDFRPLKDQILRCLHFRQIADRLDSVKDAHSSTFQWIFEGPSENSPASWRDFPKWLEQEGGCYWIQGKAGSGKSTLMKKIYEHKQTGAYLARWANRRPLTMASFFFWHLGSPLQKSQEGLLRSMLYDLIRRNPKLVMDVMPELCIEATKLKDGEMLETPTLSELTRWFRRVGKACGNTATQRVCFFIDGLDEYVGSHADLASLFLNLAKETTSIKFVLSSRPLSVFVAMLSHLPGLRVQDLTLDDIKTYAEDLLVKNNLSVRGAQIQALIDEVARKSAGVFLWIVVVVRSILEGLQSGDNIKELRHRVDKMPSELENLYRHMLDRIQPEYQAQAAEMLQLVAANFTGAHGPRGKGFIYPLPAIQLSYALEGCEDALEAPIKQCPEEEEKLRITEVELRTRSRCLGLIELRHPHNLTLPTETFYTSVVEPFHRTAMEFLGDPDVAVMLRRLTSRSSFNPYLSLFCSTIRMAKISPSVVAIGTDEFDTSPYRNLRPALTIASNADLRGHTVPQEYFEELDHVLSMHWRNAHAYKMAQEDEVVHHQRRAESHWFSLMLRDSTKQDSQPGRKALHSNALPNAIVHPDLRHQLLTRRKQLGLLPVMLIFPMTTYMELYLEQNALRNQDLTLLLSFLVQRLGGYIQFEDFEVELFTSRTEAAFTMLLGAGADPNAPCIAAKHGHTLWTQMLVTIHRNLFSHNSAIKGVAGESAAWDLDEEQCHVFGTILKAFIARGATLSVFIGDAKNRLTPMGILERLIARNERTLIMLKQTMKRNAAETGDSDTRLVERCGRLEALQDVMRQVVSCMKLRKEHDEEVSAADEPDNDANAGRKDRDGSERHDVQADGADSNKLLQKGRAEKRLAEKRGVKTSLKCWLKRLKLM